MVMTRRKRQSDHNAPIQCTLARLPEGPGWGCAFYEPPPFDITPGPACCPVNHIGQEAAAAMGITPAMGR
jgi:hypothetical protein